MTPPPNEERPPGDGREAAASEEKKSKVNKQNTIAALLRQAGTNVCGMVRSTDFENGEAVAPTFREQRDG
jgi:hypothetical protein